MQKITVKARETISKADGAIPYVVFPLHGLLSSMIIFEDGAVAEAGMVGNEGLVGLSVLLGDTRAPTEAVCQVAGACLRIPADALLQEMKQSAEFRNVGLRYALAFFHQTAQSAACNRTHSTEQRLCRQLLMTHDRLGEDRLPLTQDFLAQMLAVRRASINTMVAILQQAGFIRHSRGAIEVVNRSGLEASCCECYAAIQREYERLLC